jgi:hypothetical protein
MLHTLPYFIPLKEGQLLLEVGQDRSNIVVTVVSTVARNATAGLRKGKAGSIFALIAGARLTP